MPDVPPGRPRLAPVGAEGTAQAGRDDDDGWLRRDQVVLPHPVPPRHHARSLPSEPLGHRLGGMLGWDRCCPVDDHGDEVVVNDDGTFHAHVAVALGGECNGADTPEGAMYTPRPEDLESAEAAEKLVRIFPG